MSGCVELHVVGLGESMSEENGSAVATIARELVTAARHRGTPAYVLVGDQANQTYDWVRPVIAAKPRSRLARAANLLSRFILGRTIWPDEEVLPTGDKPGIVFLHNRPWSAALFRAAFPGARVVLYLHNRVMRWVPRWAKRRALAEFDAVVCVSSYLVDDLRRRIGSEGVVPVVCARSALPSVRLVPVEGISGDGDPSEEIDVLYVGRVVPAKGVHFLLLALWGLRARVAIVGGAHFSQTSGSPYERAILGLARLLRPPAVVTGMVSRSQVAQFRARARVTVIPSAWQEPLGLTVLEAMQSPSAVIATRSGGIPELAAQGGVALVPRRSVWALRKAIRELLNDEPARMANAEAGQESACVRGRSWQQVYDDLLTSLPRLWGD